MHAAVKLIAVALLTLGAPLVHAQAGTAVKQAAKGTAETARQGAENAKAAVFPPAREDAAPGQGRHAVSGSTGRPAAQRS